MNAIISFNKREFFAALFILFILACAGCDPTTENNKKDVTITWEDPDDIEYGTPLGPTQLNATASAPGVLVYTPPVGTILEIGNDQFLRVEFTPDDDKIYMPATSVVMINVVKAKSWVLTQKIIQWAEPWKDGDNTYLNDVPWNVVFSMVNQWGTTFSTVFTGNEGNVTRTRTETASNGNSTTLSKTDTWSGIPAEMIPKQEYTIKMKATAVGGLGNGMEISAFGTYDQANATFIGRTTYRQTAFYTNGEKSLTIKTDKPTNATDALKNRVIQVNLSTGSGGIGTENGFSYLYVYEWK